MEAVAQLRAAAARRAGDRDRPLTRLPGAGALALRGCREQPPFVGDSLEMLRAAVLEPNPRSGDEIFDCAGHEHFPGAGEGSDARGDVDRDPADVVVHELDLAGVQADAYLQAERAGGIRGRP